MEAWLQGEWGTRVHGGELRADPWVWEPHPCQHFQGGWPWACQVLAHLEHEALPSSPLSHHQCVDCRAKGSPMGRRDDESQKIHPKDSFCRHRDISWRSTLYQALQMWHLISPWQWPHVAVHSERWANLLKIMGLASSRVKLEPGSLRDPNTRLVHHTPQCLPSTNDQFIRISRRAAGIFPMALK